MPRLEDIDTTKEIELREVHNGATALRFVKQEVPNLVMLTWFGSHLYGTHTIESDLDFKGIYLIPERELILGKFTKSLKFSTKKDSGEKNQANDVDIEIYSLHYFLELLAHGETVALDMIHSPSGYPYGLLYWSQLWTWIHERRSKFYTRSMKAFVGYARKQAAKYGIKGSRIAELRVVLDLMGYHLEANPRLSQIWNDLYVGEHVHKIKKTGCFNVYQILGKQFQETVSVAYIYPILGRMLDEYGMRALAAEKNEGVDWKAMSHAVRAAHELYDIFQFGDMAFPRYDAAYLLGIKKGVMEFKTVSAQLEKMMSVLEALSLQVDYPAKVNPNFIKNITLMAYGWPTGGRYML